MDTSIVATNFARWNDALQTGDPKQVAALYHENLSLLPTLAPRTINDRTGCERYFDFFCSLHPVARIAQEFIYPLTDDSYAHAGIYEFTVDRGDGREQVDARFSMVWRKVGDNWMILHHHSSRVPNL